MVPPTKKCKGCATAVANPVTCPRCDTVSHPACLGRTGHPWQNGMLLNCDPCLPRSAAADVNVLGSQSVISQPSCPSVDVLKDMMRSLVREEIREEMRNFRDEIVSSIRTELADIKTKMSDLDIRVCQLELNSSGSATQPLSSPMEMDAIMAEMKDRQVRAKNLIIHGLPESSNSSLDLARSRDLDGVKFILDKIQTSDYTNLTVRKLGKRGGPTPRPLCAVLNSPEAVISILRGKSRYPGPCIITDEKTRTQR